MINGGIYSLCHNSYSIYRICLIMRSHILKRYSYCKFLISNPHARSCPAFDPRKGRRMSIKLHEESGYVLISRSFNPAYAKVEVSPAVGWQALELSGLYSPAIINFQEKRKISTSRKAESNLGYEMHNFINSSIHLYLHLQP